MRKEKNCNTTELRDFCSCRNVVYTVLAKCEPGSDWLRAGLSGDWIPVWARFSAPVLTDSGAHPASCTMCTGSFPEVKSGRGLTLTPHCLLVPWSWKGRVIPPLPLKAVRPVQSLSACTGVHFTLPQCLYKGALYLTSVPVQGCTLHYLSACSRVTFTLTFHASEMKEAVSCLVGEAGFKESFDRDTWRRKTNWKI